MIYIFSKSALLELRFIHDTLQSFNYPSAVPALEVLYLR